MISPGPARSAQVQGDHWRKACPNRNVSLAIIADRPITSTRFESRPSRSTLRALLGPSIRRTLECCQLLPLHFQRFGSLGPIRAYALTPAKRFDSFTFFVDQYVHEILKRKECYRPMSRMMMGNYTLG
jgi:hypothetical protein